MHSLPSWASELIAGAVGRDPGLAHLTVPRIGRLLRRVTWLAPRP
jgi:hypothetical protein